MMLKQRKSNLPFHDGDQMTNLGNNNNTDTDTDDSNKRKLGHDILSWIISISIILIFIGIVAVIMNHHPTTTTTKKSTIINNNKIQINQLKPIIITKEQSQQGQIRGTTKHDYHGDVDEKKDDYNKNHPKEQPQQPPAPQQQQRQSKKEIIPPRRIPAKLWDAKLDDLWEFYNCNYYFDDGKKKNGYDRPINHKPIWEQMRFIYINLMNPSEELKMRLIKEETAMQIPYYVRKVQGKGVGLFAKDDINKGSVIYDGDHGGHVEFQSSHDYRRYMFHLPEEYMSCLVMQCSAVESHSETNPREGAYIALDMDDGCFANDANNKEEQNVGGRGNNNDDDDDDKNKNKNQKKTDHGGDDQNSNNNNNKRKEKDDCYNCDFATKNIKKDQELLWSYGDFVYPFGWFKL